MNLWLASVAEAHPHHLAARKWWSERVIPSGARVAFCRITQMGFLRLLTNESVMGAQKRTVPQAWQVYRQVVSQKPVLFAHEPKRLEEELANLIRLGGASPTFWTDAYLAAFAIAGNLSFATFDRGFERFSRLELQRIRTLST